MRHNALRLLVLVFLTPAIGAGGYAPSQLPRPQHYVEDYANVIKPEHEHALNGVLQELEHKTGVQYIVLTVPTTGGIPIDQYSLEVARDNWKLGQQGKDNGMLLVIAVSDRKYRFTPGQGLEGFLTDSYLSSLGERTLVPRLKQGQYSEGIRAVSIELVRRIASEVGATLTSLPGQSRSSNAPAVSQQPSRPSIPQRQGGRIVTQRRSQPIPMRHVGGRGLGWLMVLPCCLLPFLALPIVLIGLLGAGRLRGTSGAFFPMMFHGLGGHSHYGHHGFGGFGRRGPFGGGPFGGGFGGFGGGMGHRFGGSTGGGFGHFGGGGGGHFSGHGAGGSW